jgi:hypothetical protein
MKSSLRILPGWVGLIFFILFGIAIVLSLVVIGNLNIKGIAVDETEADSPLARGPF